MYGLKFSYMRRLLNPIAAFEEADVDPYYCDIQPFLGFSIGKLWTHQVFIIADGIVFLSPCDALAMSANHHSHASLAGVREPFFVLFIMLLRMRNVLGVLRFW